MPVGHRCYDVFSVDPNDNLFFIFPGAGKKPHETSPNRILNLGNARSPVVLRLYEANF